MQYLLGNGETNLYHPKTSGRYAVIDEADSDAPNCSDGRVVYRVGDIAT